MLDGARRARRRLGARCRDADRARRATPTSSSCARRCRRRCSTRAATLRAAIRHGAGLDMIPIEAATDGRRAGRQRAGRQCAHRRRACDLRRAWRCCAASARIDRDLRAARAGWPAATHAELTATNSPAARIGIVGMGAVGREVAAIAAARLRPRRPRQQPQRRAACRRASRFAALDELVAQSDIVVLCCPLTPETTRPDQTRERIARMKPDALLINVVARAGGRRRRR